VAVNKNNTEGRAIKSAAIPAISQVDIDPKLFKILSPIKQILESGVLPSLAAQEQVNSKLSQSLSGAITENNLGNYIPSGLTDLSTPPAPTGLAASGALANIMLTWNATSYTNVAYTEIWRAQTDNFSNATLIGTGDGLEYVDNIGSAATRYYWIRYVSKADIKGAFNAVPGVSGTTGTDPAYMLTLLTNKIGYGQFDTAAGVYPVRVVAVLPTLPDALYPVGTQVYLTTDGKMYRNVANAWTASFAAVDMTGQVIAGQIADAALTTAKFAASIEPVTLVTSVPGAKSTSMVFNTTDGKMYRWNGSAYISTVATTDITGTLADAQLAGIAASKITGQLTDAQLAGIAASKMTGSITSTQITDGAISTPKILAGAITTAKIATDAVTANEIAAGTITAIEIAAGAITAGKIAAGSIVSTDIAAGAITAGKIAALSITAAEIAADTITAGQIAAGAISASEIAAGAITADKLFIGSKGAALNDDPACSDITAWTGTGITVETVSDGKVGNTVLRSPTNIPRDVVAIKKFPIDPNKTYRIHAWARKNVAANGTLYIGAHLVDSAGSQISGDGSYWSYDAASNVSGSTSWTEYNASIGFGTSKPFPANGRALAPIALLNYSGTAGYMEIQDFRIEEVLPGTLIQDGAITTNKIVANAITAGKIAVGTITANELAAGAITAGKIATGAIIAGDGVIGNLAIGTAHMIDGTITNAKIGALAVDDAKIASLSAAKLTTGYLDAARINVGSLSGDKITVNSLNGDRITANSIVASQINANGLSIKDPAGNVILQAGSGLGFNARFGGNTTNLPADNATSGKSLVKPLNQWNLSSQVITTVSDGKIGSEVLRLAGGLGYSNAGVFYPIDRTKIYRTRFWARPSADNASGVLYFCLQQFTNSTGTTTAINGGRSPYKPSGWSRAMHIGTYGDTWGEYTFTWTDADWQSDMRYVRPEFLDNYPSAAGYWEIQDFTFEEVTEAVDAKTTATQALSDATTKAEAARVAAINAAAAAADAKVAAAKVASDAYADGKVTAEEQRAINDATAKANAAQTAAINAAAADATAKTNLVDIVARQSGNLIKNGNSEGVNPTGAEAHSIGTGTARNGTKMRLLTNWTGGVISGFRWVYWTNGDGIGGERLPCSAGDTYHFEVWARCYVTPVTIVLNFSWRNSAGTEISNTLTYPTTTTTYEKYSSTAVAPAGATSFVMVTGVQNQPNATEVYFDDAYLERKQQAAIDAQSSANTAQTTAVSAAGVSLVPTGSTMTIVGNTATKTGGIVDSWTAGFYSKDSYTGGAYVSFVVDSLGQYMIGLNSITDRDLSSYESLDYCLYVVNTRLHRYVSGAYLDLDTNIAIGDVLSITYDGITMLFRVNGAVIPAATLVVTITNPLFIDASFHTIGASVKNIQFGAMTSLNDPSVKNPQTWANVVNTTVVGSTITSLVAGWGSSNAQSIKPLGTGTAYVRATVSVGQDQIIGLSLNPTADNNYYSINYAAYANSGSFSVYNGSSSIGTFGACVVGDTIEVIYNGITVKYFVNGHERYSQAAAAGLVFYAKVAFSTAGQQFTNVQSGSSVNFADSTINNSYSLSKSANSILSATVSMSAVAGAGFVAGSLTWNSTGGWVSGSGVAMTPGGLVGYAGSATPTFSLNATTGALTLSGSILAAGLDVGTAGNIRGGQTAYDTGTGFYLGYSGAAHKFSIGIAGGVGIRWNGTSLVIKQAPFTLAALSDWTGTLANSTQATTTRTATPTGGDSPYTYNWMVENDPDTIPFTLTNKTSATVTVSVIGVNNFASATLTCMVFDVNGRVGVTSCALAKTVGTPP